MVTLKGVFWMKFEDVFFEGLLDSSCDEPMVGVREFADGGGALHLGHDARAWAAAIVRAYDGLGVFGRPGTRCLRDVERGYARAIGRAFADAAPTFWTKDGVIGGDYWPFVAVRLNDKCDLGWLAERIELLVATERCDYVSMPAIDCAWMSLWDLGKYGTPESGQLCGMVVDGGKRYDGGVGRGLYFRRMDGFVDGQEVMGVLNMNEGLMVFDVVSYVLMSAILRELLGRRLDEVTWTQFVQMGFRSDGFRRDMMPVAYVDTERRLKISAVNDVMFGIAGHAWNEGDGRYTRCDWGGCGVRFTALI
jgi:hypothetical protein